VGTVLGPVTLELTGTDAPRPDPTVLNRAGSRAIKSLNRALSWVAAKPNANYLAVIECLLAHFAWAFTGGNAKRVVCECVG
jgi:hypothetical protein